MQKMVIIAFGLFLFSCKDTSVDQNQTGLGMIFETEYINFAWGLAYQGKEIDQEGNIYTYDPGKDSASVLFHADGYYSQVELVSKFSHHKLFIGTVAADSLGWIRNLASTITMNEYSDTMRIGADMGSVTFSVYLYRASVGKYQRISLKVEGDVAYFNKSESAIALADWMKRN